MWGGRLVGWSTHPKRACTCVRCAATRACVAKGMPMETRGVTRKAMSRAFFSTLPGLRARREGMVNIHQLLQREAGVSWEVCERGRDGYVEGGGRWVVHKEDKGKEGRQACAPEGEGADGEGQVGEAGHDVVHLLLLLLLLFRGGGG